MYMKKVIKAKIKVVSHKPRNHFNQTILPSKKQTKKQIKEIDGMENRIQKTVRLSPKNFISSGKREGIPEDALFKDCVRLFPTYKISELKKFFK